MPLPALPTSRRTPRRDRLWKFIGLAGIAGVVATGAAIARAERRRQAYTPEEIRDRLHRRHAEAAARTSGDT